MQWFLNKEDEILCAGFLWLRTGKISGLLGGRKRTSRWYKMQEMSWLPEELTAYKGGFCMELFS